MTGLGKLSAQRVAFSALNERRPKRILTMGPRLISVNVGMLERRAPCEVHIRNIEISQR